MAQALANSTVKAKLQANPDMEKDKAAIKKASQQAIYDARNSVGASGKDVRIQITDKEWEAIQAGAVPETKLAQILRYADADELRQRAMPRASTQLSDAKINKIKAMIASGHTLAEIAADMRVSTSTISKYANE